MANRTDLEQTVWFSMWFLGAIVTFGIAFFPMFYRLIENRNRHFRREAILEKQIANWLAEQGKKVPPIACPRDRNAKVWTASIIFIIPAFIITYYLSKDLQFHEEQQDMFLAQTLPQRMFMPQTIPIKKYALITIFTLGIGGVYWLYRVVNLYNAHFKAQWKVEKEITRLMREKTLECV